MATTQNTYTGNGSTTNYSFTFPYLQTSDIKASINGVATTAFTLANATTVSFNTAPANGAAIRIYRETANESLNSTFYPGSAIRATDLNTNFTQGLYVSQETSNIVLNALLPNNSVQTSMIQDAAVTSAKLGSDLTIDHASGTATAPSIAFDSNTGIYSPGEDQLAISTGGTGKVFVAANGNVGFRINPSCTIDAYQSGTSQAILRLADADSRTVELRTANAAGLQAGVGTVTNQDFVAFTGNTERFRITSDGKVGIGTSSPNYALDVRTTGTTISSSFTSDQSEQYIALKDSGTTLGHVRLGSTSGAMLFNAGNAERLRITSTGNVGIGTSGPGSKLEIRNDVQATTSLDTTAIKLYNNLDGGSGIEFLNAVSGKSKISFGVEGAGGATDDTYLGFSTSLNAGALTERMRITSNGNVGIGTSSPDSKLHVAGAGVITHIAGTYNFDGFYAGAWGVNGGAKAEFIAHTSASNSRSWRISHDTDSAAGALLFSYADSAASYGSLSYTERMRIDNAGRVGINTTSLTQQFVVSHTGRDGIAIADTNGTSTQANLLFSNTRAAGTSNYYVLGYANAVNTFIVYSNGNVLNTNNSYAGISDVKLKENIVDANSQWNDIKALQVRKYNFKEGQTHTQIGLVAQEVELVSPGLVTETPDRDEEGNDLGTVTKSVNYSVLYMKAVKALQEAMERIETLEAKVAALETNP